MFTFNQQNNQLEGVLIYDMINQQIICELPFVETDSWDSLSARLSGQTLLRKNEYSYQSIADWSMSLLSSLG